MKRSFGARAPRRAAALLAAALCAAALAGCAPRADGDPAADRSASAAEASAAPETTESSEAQEASESSEAPPEVPEPSEAGSAPASTEPDASSASTAAESSAPPAPESAAPSAPAASSESAVRRADFPEKEVFFAAMEDGTIGALARQYGFVAETETETINAGLLDAFYQQYAAGRPAQLVFSTPGNETGPRVYTVNYAGGGTAYDVHLCGIHACRDYGPYQRMENTPDDLVLWESAEPDAYYVQVTKEGRDDRRVIVRAVTDEQKALEAERESVFAVVRDALERYRAGDIPAEWTPLPEGTDLPALDAADRLTLNPSDPAPDGAARAEAIVRLTGGRGPTYLVFSLKKGEDGWTIAPYYEGESSVNIAIA